MAKEKKTWTVETADGLHTIEFHPKSAFKPAMLYVDGQYAPLNFSRLGFEGIDQPLLTGGGHDIRLVSTRKMTDVAYDGVYLESGNTYEPLPKMSKANWVFVIISLCAAILGGAIPCACAFGGAAAGTGVALSKKLQNKTKIILGVVLMVLTWAAAILVSVFAVKGMKAATKNLKSTFGKDEYKIALTQAFKQTKDTDGLTEDGLEELIFAAVSEDTYAYAKKTTFKQLKLIYGIEWTEPSEYLTNILDVNGSELKTGENGTTYVVLNEKEYCYVCSVIAKNGAFYYTELYCVAEDAEKLVPKMIEYTNSITIESAAPGTADEA